MTRLFSAIGIDYQQWKALTVVALKNDFRSTSLGQRMDSREVRVVFSLLFQAVFYTLFGTMIAYVVWASRDPWLTGTIASTYIAFIVGTAVVLDHHSVISSPVDYAVLGFRPVSSRTYFAVKLTNILVYTTALTTVAAWVPLLVALVRHGWGISAALLLDIYASSTATTLAIALGYATVLRAVGPDAIERVLSYVQMIMSFAVYGGQFLISGILSQSRPGNWAMPETLWLLIYPGTWFGSYLALADGQVSVRVFAPALASVTALALMATRLGGRLSLDYSERLGAMTVAARAKAARAAEGRRRGGLWFATGEARAVALLVRSQFRHDQRFRMGVLGLLPFTLLYMLMGIRSGAIADPFSATRTMQGWPMTMAVLASPAMLRMLLTRSDAFRASWIFFTCPSDRMRIARSSKDVLVVFFLVPYLLLVAAVLLLRRRQHRPRADSRRLPRTARPPRAADRAAARSGAALLETDAEGPQHVAVLWLYAGHHPGEPVHPVLRLDDVQQPHIDRRRCRRHRPGWCRNRLAHPRARAAAGAVARIRGLTLVRRRFA